MHDAHCHPFDSWRRGVWQTETRRFPYTASAWGKEDFEFNRRLREAGAAKQPPLESAPLESAQTVFLSFGVHPGLIAQDEAKARDSQTLLEELAASRAIDAVGEAGFDLFDERHRAVEGAQDKFFALGLEATLKYDLPLVLHVRKAMHKIFPYIRDLKRLPAVVFHSYAGTEGEAESFLRRGVNAFFSFGNILVNNHKTAQKAAALLPAARLLFETDAPYQSARGAPNSCERDLPAIIAKTAALRQESAVALEATTDKAFWSVFGRGGK